jgi:hypothetical protein
MPAVPSSLNIVAATQDYEAWLARRVVIYQPDLDFKHKQMASADDGFPFFRGTYYRWAQTWAETAGAAADAPDVLAVGDLHVENFGTWRDSDGRLCWGINDFDEADRVPYTNDLVRLAASVWFARRTGALDVKLSSACKALLSGYRQALEAGGVPFVLEEQHPELRALAMTERDPARFWKKLTALLVEPAVEPPEAARQALEYDLPAEGLTTQIRFRARVGMGSLGRPRYLALAVAAGAWVAREAKALAAPATAWVKGQPPGAEALLGDALARACRSPDPFYRVSAGWVVRRLGPRCSRIELGHLHHVGDIVCLLKAMGSETANIHLGTPEAIPAVTADLAQRPKGWLEDAARACAARLDEDWRAWRKARRK